MRRALFGLVMLVACDQGRSEETSPATPPSSEMAMTKEEDVPQVATPSAPDPAALERIIDASSEQEVPAATSEDGATAVGTDTGIPGDELPVPASTATPRVMGGAVEIQPQLSSPAIEQQARAQIYWSLRECKGPDGRPPPPESITLAFTLREDGTVDPASVLASADDESLQKTAECVLRAFSATPFEGPLAARRTPARIRITWPSVD
ncbi:MAG TPA: hypothetical protein ENK57_16175 [Polyangiaceae bacterium]|nr:hypothetical protein [Polyangiaceae bacterium]